MTNDLHLPAKQEIASELITEGTVPRSGRNFAACRVSLMLDDAPGSVPTRTESHALEIERNKL